jgi:DNA-binding PadR family transcriptional regulator
VKAGTKYAVLGLLHERPSYGYEVLVRFRRAFDAAQWGISPQGLYASLDRLERDGLIEPVAVEDRYVSRRQPKTPYRVTPTGASELRRFLETPLSADPSRAELLVRLQCVARRDADAEAAQRMLDGYERACLDELGRIGSEGSRGLVATRDSLLERLAIEERRLGIQARLMWIDYARRELREAVGELRGRRPEGPVQSVS